jgi:hypothetical protein
MERRGEMKSGFDGVLIARLCSLRCTTTNKEGQLDQLGWRWLLWPLLPGGRRRTQDKADLAELAISTLQYKICKETTG